MSQDPVLLPTVARVTACIVERSRGPRAHHRPRAQAHTAGQGACSLLAHDREPECAA